jgi:hypothetical protein
MVPWLFNIVKAEQSGSQTATQRLPRVWNWRKPGRKLNYQKHFIVSKKLLASFSIKRQEFELTVIQISQSALLVFSTGTITATILEMLFSEAWPFLLKERKLCLKRSYRRWYKIRSLEQFQIIIAKICKPSVLFDRLWKHCNKINYKVLVMSRLKGIEIEQSRKWVGKRRKTETTRKQNRREIVKMLIQMTENVNVPTPMTTLTN